MLILLLERVTQLEMGLPTGPILAVQTVAYIEADPSQGGHLEADPEADGFPKITKV